MIEILFHTDSSKFAVIRSAAVGWGKESNKLEKSK